MNYTLSKPSPHRPAVALTVVLLALLAPAASSQQTLPPAPNDPEPPKDGVVEMSRFVVSTDEQDGYRATTTLAGTRIKTDVKDIGSALSIITSQFLEDTGALNTEDLLVYTTGTEVGGTKGNFTGTGDDVVLTERAALATPHTNNRVRGLAGADNTRDLYLTDFAWDAYNVDRVEIQRGPNSILFGLGKPGGVINASLKQAQYANRGEVQARIGSHGSLRGSLDYNRVLIPRQLALRVNLLADHKEYEQRPAFRDDERIYAAARFDPGFLNRGSARTSLRVNFESGKIEANNPRSLPPMDRFSSWFETGTTTVGNQTFNNMNQFVGDYRYRNVYVPSVPGSGFLVGTSPNYQPGVSDANNGNYVFFGDPNSGLPTDIYYVNQTLFTESGGLAPNGSIDGRIGGLYGANRFSMAATYSELQRRRGVPFAFAYKNQSITDPSIFDFYNKLIDGPNKQERQDFDATNIALSQTFIDGRIGFELTYDSQDYELSNKAPQYGMGTGDAAITVDINAILPDGRPNPNVGRPMIVNRSVNGGFARDIDREVFNLTGYAEWQAKDLFNQPWLIKLLGKHVFTGAINRNQVDALARTWGSAAVESIGWPTPANEILTNRREMLIMTYLGPDMRGLPSPSGLNLQNLQEPLQFPAGNIMRFNSTWNRPTDPAAPGYVNPNAPWVHHLTGGNSRQSENPANYVGWETVPTTTYSIFDGDEDQLTFNATRTRDRIDSEFLVWQGHMFDGTVVPTIGYRKDEARAYAKAVPTTSRGIVSTNPADYELPADASNTVEGTTKSYSVVLHSPNFVKRHLPWGMDISLMFNKSSNFEPVANRYDMLGVALPKPTGKTKDYGISIGLLDERVRLRVNRYEASTENSTYVPQNHWYIMQIENLAWIRAKRLEAGLSGDPRYAGNEYNYGQTIGGNFVQTPEERQLQQRHVEAVLGAFNPQIWSTWGLQANDARWQDNMTAPVDPPSGTVATSDTVSKGTEYELYIRPTRNWDIFINAARTKASRDNTGGSQWNNWIDARNEVWNGLAGGMWTGPTGENTYSDAWNNSFYNNYQLVRQRDGSSMPEIRRWRFNLTNNYRFTEGALKGVNIGGAYRWEDRVGIGYRSVVADINGSPLETIDLNQPFWGPSTSTVDLWVGYQRALTKRVRWKIQLNVQNVFGEDELVPINTQPDGSPAAFRIRYGADWFVTNTFSF